MQASEELLTVAELAIGLAGFSGVVVAFGHRGALQPIDRLRFIALLSAAINAAFLAFVPFLATYAGLIEGPMWRASSGIALTTALIYGATISIRLNREARKIGSTAPAWSYGALFTLGIGNLVLQATNASGWPLDPNPFPYLLGLVIWLLWSALFFGFLVLLHPDEPAA